MADSQKQKLEQIKARTAPIFGVARKLGLGAMVVATEQALENHIKKLSTSSTTTDPLGDTQ